MGKIFYLRPRGGNLPPPAPTGLVLSGVTSSSITLTWNAVPTATFYVVRRFGVQIATNVISTTYTDSGLPSGTLESYTVSAVNGFGEGPQSAPASATTSGSGGASAPNTYAAFPTWYANASTGADPVVGSHKAVGWIYKSYEAAMEDVFIVGGTGNRRIVVQTPLSTPAWRGTFTGTVTAGSSQITGIASIPANCRVGAEVSDAFVTGANQGIPPSALITAIGSNTINMTANAVHTHANITIGFDQGGYFPAGAPTGSLWVIEGDTSLPLTSQPIIDGGASSNQSAQGFFHIGEAGTYTGASTGNIQNIVIRNFEMRNSTSNHIMMHGGTGSNMLFEYNHHHHNIYPQGAGNGGPDGATFTPAVTNGPGSAGGIGVEHGGGSLSHSDYNNYTVQYCKFDHFSANTVGFGNSLNCVCFETYYSNNVTFDHCLFDSSFVGIRLKLFDPGSQTVSCGTADNYTITNNIFSNCYNALMHGTGGNLYQPPNNWVVQNNLFYGTYPAGATQIMGASGFPYSTATQGTGFVFSNNTIAEDWGAGLMLIGQANAVVRDNISMVSASGAWQLETWDGADPGVGAIGATTFSTFNNNAYAGQTQWWLQRQVAVYNTPIYKYTGISQWQSAYTVPLPAGPSPTDLAPLPGSHNPDAAGVWIPNLAGIYGTTPANNFVNAASRNYTLVAGSPLNTASTTAGPVGYTGTPGPGW